MAERPQVPGVPVEHELGSAGDQDIVKGPRATDDDVLKEAGIEHARALVAAIDTDAENLYVVLSGRSLCPDLFIVARARDLSSDAKLARAGADRVVNPQEIGGARMAAFVLQPHVTAFAQRHQSKRCAYVCILLDGFHLPDGESRSKMLELGPKLVIVTGGAKGATGYTRDHEITVASERVTVVDTVGAGDTFNAGVLASLHDQGLLAKAAVAALGSDAIRAALTLGSKAAAVTVSRAGANPPWRHELG